MNQKNISIVSGVPKKIDVVKIKSSAFQNGEDIPVKYTCDGENLIPALQISDIPMEAKSLALIVEDPDAPGGVWDHLVMWNIPAQEFSTGEGKLPVGIIGKGSSGNTKYEGPCPPKGNAHRYFFDLYALDTLINLPAGAKKLSYLMR